MPWTRHWTGSGHMTWALGPVRYSYLAVRALCNEICSTRPAGDYPSVVHDPSVSGDAAVACRLMIPSTRAAPVLLQTLLSP